MGKLVATNIRLPREDLIAYRQMALEQGISFSEYLRIVLKKYSQQILVKGKADMRKININHTREHEPIWNFRPFRSGIKDGAKNHDKYIYGR